MFSFNYASIICPILVVRTCAFYSNDLDSNLLKELEDPSEERFLIGATAGVPFNASQLATIVGLVATAFLPLLVLCTISLVLLGYLWHDGDRGYSGYSNYRSLIGFDQIDWESISILNLLGAAEETYRNFNPSDFECQKRLICELHQNAESFGTFASTAVKYFGYLKYVEVFNVPESFKNLAEEYVDASERASAMKIDCANLYSQCEFSIKSLHDKYFSKNNI